MDASIACMMPHNKALIRENDTIEVDNSANFPFTFNPKAAECQR